MSFGAQAAGFGEAQNRALSDALYGSTLPKIEVPADGVYRSKQAPDGHPYAQRVALGALWGQIVEKNEAGTDRAITALRVPFDAKTLASSRFADGLAFTGAWARAVLLLQERKDPRVTRLASQKPAVKTYLASKFFADDMARWSAGSKGAQGSALQANQLLWAALDAASIAEVMEDKAWATRARDWEAKALALQGSDGAFPDTRSMGQGNLASFQSASLDRLLWLSLADAKADKNTARQNAINRGMQWHKAQLKSGCGVEPSFAARIAQSLRAKASEARSTQQAFFAANLYALHALAGGGDTARAQAELLKRDCAK
jgi:hypothetical protein